MAALLAFAAVLQPLPFQPPFFLVVIGALLTTSVLGIYLAGWRCPRCNDYFHYRFSLVDCFRRSCAHCGLALYTPIYSGFCHRCGYDLCANASGQSPECGQETGKGKNQFDRREDRTP